MREALFTLYELCARLVRAGRWFLLPLVLVLVLAAVLLLATSHLGALAPFVYAIF